GASRFRADGSLGPGFGADSGGDRGLADPAGGLSHSRLGRASGGGEALGVIGAVGGVGSAGLGRGGRRGRRAGGGRGVGLRAPLATWAAWFRYEQIYERGNPWRRAFIAFNLMGLADHVSAVILGTGSFPHMYFNVDPSTSVFAAMPMVLFPIYMVPFADLAHL